MPFVILIPLAALLCLTYIVKLCLDHAKWKAGRSADPDQLSAADTSMKVSELEELLQASVVRALQPLDARLDALERGLPVATKTDDVSEAQNA